MWEGLYLCVALQLNVDKLMHLVDACRPDWYQPLCDSDTSRGSSLKRVRRAVDRTITYLDRCIEMQRTLPVSSLCYLSGVWQAYMSVDDMLLMVRVGTIYIGNLYRIYI